MENDTINMISKTLFENVVNTIVNQTNSPYQKTKKKIQDIDIDYFETIQRNSNVLNTELNMSLRERVLQDFAQLFDQHFCKSGLSMQIQTMLKEQMEEHHVVLEEDKKRILHQLQDLLTAYANDRLLFRTQPEYTLEELNDLYKEAQKVTFIENITQGNKEDILKFYEALLHRTAWDCEDELECKTSDYLKRIME